MRTARRGGAAHDSPGHRHDRVGRVPGRVSCPSSIVRLPGLRLGAAIILNGVNGRSRCACPSPGSRRSRPCSPTSTTGAAHRAPGPPVSRQPRRQEPGAGVAATLARSSDSGRSRGSYWRLLEGGEQDPVASTASERALRSATAHGRLESVKEIGRAPTSSGSSSTARRDPLRRDPKASRPTRRSSAQRSTPRHWSDGRALSGTITTQSQVEKPIAT
jgi:hypothetical protein